MAKLIHASGVGMLLENAQLEAPVRLARQVARMLRAMGPGVKSNLTKFLIGHQSQVSFGVRMTHCQKVINSTNYFDYKFMYFGIGYINIAVF